MSINNKIYDGLHTKLKSNLPLISLIFADSFFICVYLRYLRETHKKYINWLMHSDNY